MYNLSYKPILVAPVLLAILTMIGATTSHAYASVDCGQSNPDPRCQQVTSSPPQPPSCDTTTADGQCISHHSVATVFCLAGVLLGVWIFPPSASSAPNEAAACVAVP